jgi:membrane-associated phospholipid phosphatase
MLSEKTYKSMISYLKETGTYRYIEFLTQLIVDITVLGYTMTLILAFLSEKKNDFRFVIPQELTKINLLLVPLIGVIGVSLLRKRLDHPRPYELYHFEPLYKSYADPKFRPHGAGFPSRHVFSIFIIAVCELPVYKLFGVVLLIMGVFLAVFRVIMGVHFPRDVIAGALLGSVLGVIGSIIIPMIL